MASYHQSIIHVTRSSYNNKVTLLHLSAPRSKWTSCRASSNHHDPAIHLVCRHFLLAEIVCMSRWPKGQCTHTLAARRFALTSSKAHFRSSIRRHSRAVRTMLCVMPVMEYTLFLSNLINHPKYGVRVTHAVRCCSDALGPSNKKPGIGF